MTLITEIYKISKGFPKNEAYGLITQMRRYAISIPGNMAEGYGRNSIQVGTEVQSGKVAKWLPLYLWNFSLVPLCL